MFSPAEQEVLDIIGRRKMTIAQIVDYYQGTSMEPNNYIAAVIRRIARKCDHYKLPWTLEGKGSGRGGRTVWKAKR